MNADTTYPERRPRKRLNRVVAFLLICAFTPIFVFGATVAATGTITVRVQEHSEDGVNLWIPVPAILADATLFLLPRLLPEEELAEARSEIAPMLPALRDLADEIDRLPNAVFVEVDSPTEKVRVGKSWGNLYVDVRSEDADVHVEMPARLIGSAFSLFG